MDDAAVHRLNRGQRAQAGRADSWSVTRVLASPALARSSWRSFASAPGPQRDCRPVPCAYNFKND